MKDRTMTYVYITTHDNGPLPEDEAVAAVPLTDKERDKLYHLIDKFHADCHGRRDKEAQRRLDKAAALEAEAKALRGEK